MLLFFVFHFIIGPPKWDSSHGCEIMTFRTKEKPIRGCVINKYLDKKNHFDETIVLSNNGKNQLFIIPNDNSGLYNFIEVGDSIFKDEDSLICFVKRDSIIERFIIDFGCK